MKLFVSYARVDKPLCKQIVTVLEDVHEVWYDKRLHAGQEWWNEIVERLAWCQGFVYLLSPESVASEYCQREYALATESGKQVFPVLIQGRTEIPSSLSHIHYANLSEGMEDMITLMNAITVAERRQLTQKIAAPPPLKKTESVPHQELSPSQAIGQAADAMEGENYDNAVFILKGALEKAPDGRNARILSNMLKEAEAALERQTYLREAARDYALIRELASRSSTRAMACDEFADFQKIFPDYDPDNLASLCKEESPPPQPKRPRFELPAPFAWIDIPKGKVTLITEKGWPATYIPEGKSQTFDVPAFSISKYPITNAQYTKFMEAGGYRKRRWWTDAGWDAREQGWHYTDSGWMSSGKPWTQPCYWADQKWNGAEQPVVGVSWYESLAFCLWLSEVSGEQVLLPTEQQWQRAAQGDDGRSFPWGNEWDCKRCNNLVKPCTSNQTTPVTIYEGKQKGDSPFGVVDMAGNVWEWCLTEYESGNIGIDSTNSRVLRGGSWLDSNADFFRVADRPRDLPYFRANDWGFRVSRS